MKSEKRHGECEVFKSRAFLVLSADNDPFRRRGGAARWLATLALCLFGLCGRAEFPLTIIGALNGSTDGSAVVGLTLGADGNFYGMANINGKYGGGTIFKMTPSGSISILVNFDGPNGGYPQAPLILAADGTLYGVASAVVFRLTTNGDFSTVTSFPSDGSPDRAYAPSGPLLQGKDGNLYGTTEYAGADGGGTVFKLTPAGGLTTLASFYGTNGVFPAAGLVLGNDGNFYGTTSGRYQSIQGGFEATVFKITPGGALTTLAYFDPTNDSADTPGLILGSDGNLYGTTSTGPGGQGGGTAFKMTPTGDLTILARFTNGSYPFDTDGFSETGLIQGLDGNFYGTILSTDSQLPPSTLYQMTPAGVVTSLAILPGEGGSGPIVGKDGNLYGTVGNQIYRFVPPPMFQKVATRSGNVTLT